MIPPRGPSPKPERTGIARRKVVYLLAVTAAIFLLPTIAPARWGQWLGVAVLLSLQVALLRRARIAGPAILRPVVRLKWLFVFLLGFYTVLPSDAPDSDDRVFTWLLPVVHWSLPLDLSGLDRAGIMCLQIVTLLMTSAVVRLSGDGRDLVAGLESFRLPPVFVHALDRTLELLGGVETRPRRQGRNPGQGQGAAPDRAGSRGVLRQVLTGDVSFLVSLIEGNIDRASTLGPPSAGGPNDTHLVRDVAVVTGIALCMASLKFLKILPGIPFAPGYKLVLLFPLYVLATRLTRSRWGATSVGAIMGVIGFLQGDGRFGLLEVLKHITPGIVIDRCDPLIRRLPRWAMGYCLLGLVAAAARTTTEFAVVLLLGARAEIYIFPAVRLVPNLLAGVASGFVTVVVLRAFERAAAARAVELSTPIAEVTAPSCPGRKGGGGGGGGGGGVGGAGRTNRPP